MASQVAVSTEFRAPLEAQGGSTGTAPTVAGEMTKIPYEPFLRVERQLVAWSLILGWTLLGILVWVSNRFFAG